MLTFILHRVFTGIILIFATSVVVFVLLYADSNNIALALLDTNATPEAVARKEAELGLDRPLPVQYFEWLSHAIRGDFGRSWVTGDSVTNSIMSRIGVTLSLIIGATVVSAILAIVLGVVAARRRGWIDGLLQFVSVIGHALPSFLIALAFVVLFAINLKLFPAVGYTPLGKSPVGWLWHITLPVIALSVGAIAAVSQQVRGSILDALQQEYIRTLRSRGYSMNYVVYKHALRNASGPALAVLGVQFVSLFGGAIVVEKVNALPGLGSLTLQSTIRSDIPVVMGIVIVAAVLVVVINLIVDLIQAGLNPKLRLS